MRKPSFIRGALAAVAASVALSAFAIAIAKPSPAPKAAPPKLVVVLSVDQFSSELYERYRAKFTGGLKRLSGGIVFPSGYQSHAATETCPGHSTIMTGRHPYSTGIIANNWLDPKTGDKIYCVSVDGEADGRGPQRLLVDTLGDWLKAERPGGRAFSVSGKDRAAIMMAGHHADGVYWWGETGGFVTSSFAGPAGPEAQKPAQDFNQALFANWRATPPALWPTTIPSFCAPLQKPHKFGETNISGKVPPEMKAGVEGGDFVATKEFQSELKTSPAFDPLALDFAAKLVADNQLGKGPATDVLTVSLSATDYIGHKFGNGGAESCVQVMEVDRALGKFFGALDAAGVSYVVALTADHGAVDAAERAVESGLPAQRFEPRAIIDGLNKDMKAKLALAFDPIVFAEPQQLSVNKSVTDPLLRTQIIDAAVKYLATKKPQVRAAYSAKQIEALKPPFAKRTDKLTLLERYRLSYNPERSGDISVAYEQYASLGSGKGGAVAGHGSPWNYDRRVPILFWAPGLKGKTISDPVQVVDIAPTLASMIGIKAPKTDGRCLATVATSCAR